jgi:tetratricopeptide (TPR) repeat protein
MPQDAIKHATEALSFEPDNPKAHYRLYLGYKSLNNLEKAYEHLN